jgi:hypothetical protein
MEAEHMSDALDDFAADLAEQPDQFARSRAASLALVEADAAFDACTEETFHTCCQAVTDAVQKVREAWADDTVAYNDRATVMTVYEPHVREYAARLIGESA